MVIITIIVTAVLSRLLSPEEFGIVALVSVFIAFFNLLGNLGIGPAVVQVKELSGKDLSSIFSFSVLMALLLAFIFFLSAGLIADFYSEPQLITIVRLLALSVFFNIAIIVPSALNRKHLRFKQMAIITVSVQVVTGAIAIWMATAGFSYYALVWQSILSGFFSFCVYYILYPIKPIINIKKAPLKKIASFSTYQFSFNFINYFSRNLDNILIGKYLGNASLGFYNKSYTLMLLPVRNLTHVITPVLHPVLSKHQDNKRYIYTSYLKVLKYLALLGFPVSAFLFFAAPELILIMFGPQWDESIPVFKILAVSVGIQICLSSSGAIFQSVNKTNLLFYSGLLSAVFMIGGISYGVFIGGNIQAVGYGLVVAFILNFFQGFYILIRMALNESFLSFLKIFLFPLIVSAFVAGGLFFLEKVDVENSILALLLKAGWLGLILVVVFASSEEKRKFILGIFKK